jgi:uncharacterized protein
MPDAPDPQVCDSSDVARGTGRRSAAKQYSWIWRTVRVLLVVYLVIVLIAMFMEDSLIYFPTRYPGGNWNQKSLAFDDAWFQSADGTRLHGWYVPHKNPRAFVLYCHGNAGNLSHRLSALNVFNRQVGVSTLIFDYRGYGRSEGKPSEAGILADARAARHWLAEREKIAETDIVLFGESLGGAVAVDLAARDGARALVLEKTFSSMPDVAAYHYPLLPVRWAMRTRLDSAAKIANYHGPLLQVHGEPDTIVPTCFGRALHEAANQPKKLIIYPGCDHNDPLPPEYYDELRAFLDGIAEHPATKGA